MKKHHLIWIVILIMAGCRSKMKDLPEGVSFVRTEVAFAELEWLPDSVRIVGSSPALPPDGINVGRDPSEIFVWNIKSNEYTQISDEAFSLWNDHPVWHPDLEQVIYYSNDEFGKDSHLGIVDLSGNIITKLGFGNSADWIPNRNEILVNRIAFLSLFDMESQTYRTLWSAERGWRISEFEVSPDGKEVAILVTDDPPVTQLLVVDLSQGTAQKIHESQLNISRISWAPTGNRLIFLRRGDFNELSSITRDGKCITEPFALEYELEDISWSPDGEVMAASTKNEVTGVFFFETNSQVIQDWLNFDSCH